MKTGNFKFSSIIISFVSFLLIMLVVIDYFIIYSQRHKRQHAFFHMRDHHLNLLASVIHEPLNRKAYALVEQIIHDFGSNEKYLLDVKLVAPNSAILAIFEKDIGVNSTSVYQSRQVVKTTDHKVFILKSTVSLVGIEKEIEALKSQLMIGSFLLMAVLGSIVWFLFQFLAIRPLRREVEYREQIESDLKNSYRQVQTVFDHLDFIIYVVNKTSKEVLFQNHFAEIHQKELPYSQLSDRDKNNSEIFHKPSKKWFQCIVHEVKWVNGQEALIEMYLDVSFLKESEEKMKAAKEMAESSVQVKNQFLANMSHEIRTPMNAILGLSRLIGTADPSKQKRYAQIIEESGQRLVELIDDILDVSLIETGKFKLEKGPFLIKDIVRTVCDNMQDRYSEKQIQLLTFIEPDLQDNFIGDSHRIKQILTNLIGNAYKFTEQGSIALDVKKLSQTSEKVTLQFRLTDTGVGIPSHKLSEIFHTFSQADGGINREYGGMGVGLTIAEKLIKMMEGEIKVISKPNTGSTFTFTLKVLQSNSSFSQKTENAPLPQPSKTDSSSQILIVEDESVNSMLMSYLLKQWGFEVDTAFDGLEAVEKSTEFSYRLILMDIQMPKMDGVQATTKIRTFNNETPIVALTGHSLHDFEEKGKEAGFTDYLTKPIDEGKLRNILVKYIPESGELNN